MPADGVRDLPDVSLFAADDQNDSFYPICLPEEGCSGLNPAFQEITAVGGTSAAAPAMASITINLIEIPPAAAPATAPAAALVWLMVAVPVLP